MREDGIRYKNFGREFGVGESDIVGGMGMVWEKLRWWCLKLFIYKFSLYGVVVVNGRVEKRILSVVYVD